MEVINKAPYGTHWRSTIQILGPNVGAVFTEIYDDYMLAYRTNTLDNFKISASKLSSQLAPRISKRTIQRALDYLLHIELINRTKTAVNDRFFLLLINTFVTLSKDNKQKFIDLLDAGNIIAIHQWLNYTPGEIITVVDSSGKEINLSPCHPSWYRVPQSHPNNMTDLTEGCHSGTLLSEGVSQWHTFAENQGGDTVALFDGGVTLAQKSATVAQKSANVTPNINNNNNIYQYFGKFFELVNEVKVSIYVKSL